MVAEELEKIVQLLKAQGEMRFADPAAPEQIRKFEQQNRTIFPEQYRRWLLFSDGGECFLPAGVQFYGVAHKPVICMDDPDKPGDNYVVIGALASGDPILFEKSSGAVAIYNLEGGCIEDDEVYKDFFAFLTDLKNLLGIGG